MAQIDWQGEPPAAVCFDLDDTLVDYTTNVAWEDSCALAVGEVAGIEAPALAGQVERVRAWYWSDADRHRLGRRDLRASSAEIVQLAFDALGSAPPAGLARTIADHYRDAREAAIELLPGAIDVLAACREAGVRLALVTNGSRADQRGKVERFDLERWFDHIQIEGELGFGKPLPEAYAHAIERMGIEPSRSWFVGDNLEWDVGAPQRLGFHGVWVDYGRQGPAALRDSEVRPDRVIGGVAELLAAD